MKPRRETFGDTTGEYRALRYEAALVEPTHDLTTIDGPDSVSFLQGILSQDVEQMTPGTVARSFLLNPSGKLTALLWVMRGDDWVGLASDSGLGPVVAETLNYYRIRVKAEVAFDVRVGWSLIGPRAPEDLALDEGWVERDETLLVKAPMAGLSRVIGFGAHAESHERAGNIAYTAVRVETGEPIMNLDVDEKTIPQETGLVPDAVSFTKGCYLGQELVARIDSRGHVNRHLRGVVMTENVLPPVGAEVWLGERMAGTLTSVSESLGVMAPIGLGLIRREAEPGATVEVRWGEDAASPAVVRELPLI